jgi:DNA-binding response OmpR family regulator
MKEKHVVLAVDDDPDILEELADTIRSLGYLVVTARNQVEAEKVLRKRRPCLALLDLELKTDDRSAQARIQVGFNLLERMQKQKPGQKFPIILVTAHAAGQDDLYIQAIRKGASDLVKKPFKNGELEDRIRLKLADCCGHGKPAKPSSAAEELVESDDVKTADALFFDGRPNTKRRNLIKVNGKEAWVRTKTFSVLWRLALPFWSGKDGWLKAAQIADEDNPHQAILRAREDIKSCVKDPKKTIEHNGSQYRLSTAGKKLTYNENLVPQYFQHLFEMLPKPKSNRR